MSEVVEQQGESDPVRLAFLPIWALLAVVASCPVFALVFWLFVSYPPDGPGEALALVFTGSGLILAPNLLWFGGLCLFSRWDIRRTRPSHGVAVCRMAGGIATMSIPNLYYSFAVAGSTTMENINPAALGAALGQFMGAIFLITGPLGLAGVYIGWVAGLAFGYHDGPDGHQQNKRWKVLFVLCLAGLGALTSIYMPEGYQWPTFVSTTAIAILLLIPLLGTGSRNLN